MSVDYNGRKFDYLTIRLNESPISVSLMGFDVWPKDSVLRGQVRKTFLRSFKNVEEAEKLYPDVNFSNHWTEPQNTFNHLSDENDY